MWLLLSIAFILRLINIGKAPCNDELLVLNIAGKNLSDLLALLKTTDVYPPLTYILLHYWLKINQSPEWIRLYFVIFGLASCLIIYLIAKEYLGKKTANIALTIAAFSPFLIFGSQYIRSYMDSAFFILCSTYFLLKVIKKKNVMISCVGYCVSTALAFYTFYFSALIVAAQFLFLMIFAKNRKIWILTFLIIGILFLPWVLPAVSQLQNASSMPFDWSTVGFNVGSLRLGLYARSVAALFGFDPYFFTIREGIFSRFSFSTLVVILSMSAAMFALFLYKIFITLRSRFSGRPDMQWFIPTLALLPLVFSWISASVFNMVPSTKYFLALHGIFIIGIAFLIEELLNKNKRAGIISLIILLTIFMFRIPKATSTEFDDSAVVSFLNKSARGNVVMSKASCPTGGEVNIISLETFFILDKNGRSYSMTSNDRWQRLSEEIKGLDKVWFYRVYGNDEIFGANRIVDLWLSDHDYKKKSVHKFKNADIIEYVRSK